MMNLKVGMKGSAETMVVPENTATAVGSGLVPVFATPNMVALMEAASVDAVSGGLEEGQSSVGTHLDISHDAATPIGMKVRAEAEIIAVDGKKITLKVSAYDDAGLIGRGTHERFVITVDRFLAKSEAKLNKQ